MTDHQYWDELAAGYALHGLAPDEQAVFVDHLQTCDLCTAAVTDHEFVAAQLGAIAHYRDSEQVPSWESIRATVLAGHPAESNVVGLQSRRRRYDVSRRVLAAAAAFIVLVGGGIAAWRVSRSTNSCSASSGCHRVELDSSGRGLASLVVRNDDVTVTPTDMPAAPLGKTYVLWQLPRDGRATPLTNFTAGTGSTASGRLDVAYSDTAAFAVSLENAAGAPPATPSNTLASGMVS